MTKESPHNVRHVCAAHGPKPDPKYTKMELATFIGMYCKIGFDGKAPSGAMQKEWMWVEVTGTDGDKLVGKLDNDPVYDMKYRFRDKVVFTREEIVEAIQL